MANHDLSRHLFRPANRYTGLRMQQGRSMLDSDFSEAEMLDDEAQRGMVADVVGPHGSPDMGFEIKFVATHVYDFAILAGTYYLGGLRHEIAGAAAVGATTANGAPSSPPPQWFSAQSDWLQSNRKDALPLPPTLPAASRRDLVYLVGWEQTVSAVEDREFLEMALGGPDTTARQRRMRRVHVQPDAPEDCTAAFASLVEKLQDGGHQFDWDEHELKSGARLTVVIDDEEDDDVCKPAIPPGYSGVENQALRIQLIEPMRFLWSYDNAAPLYRARTSIDSSGTRVEFLTRPRDQAHFPVAGQVLEILPFGAKLANGEFVADHAIAGDIGGGVFARVLGSYDPVAGTVNVQVEDPATLSAMVEWFGKSGIAPEKQCFYLRVWNPGDDGVSGPIGRAFKSGEEIELQGTGLRIKFSQQGIVGDHWIIAARPSTPTLVVPWTARTLEPPHGPRRFYAPLALLHWSVPAGAGRTVTVDSCRKTFRPLTRQNGCCTVTVGDESKSFGDFTSINAAIAAIPVDQPGKVCVLPGLYTERVVIVDRSDLVIEGCGASTIIRTPTGSTTSEGLITVTSGQNITLKDLTLEAKGQFGVMLFTPIVEVPRPSRKIRLDGLRIATEAGVGLDPPTLADLRIPSTPAPFPMSTVAALGIEDLRILGCTLMQGHLLSGAPNVSLVECRSALVRCCRIDTTYVPGERQDAWGGVQIGQLCQGVAIEDCEILNGIGCGVTFGTVLAVAGSSTYRNLFDPVGRFVLVEETSNYLTHACLPTSALPPGSATAVTVTARCDSSDIRIRRNHIDRMGSSTVSVIGFAPTPIEGAAYEALSTSDLVISDNRMSLFGATFPASAPPAAYRDVTAVGGIVLGVADNLRIHDNEILAVSDERPGYPDCGIYVLYGENVAIENNNISASPTRAGPFLPGNRAGIALQMVGRRVTGTDAESLDVDGDPLLPAARVRGNTVQQGIGRALQVWGIGPMFIEGNVLVSRGRGVLPEVDTFGRCVDIHNIGQSSELVEAGMLPAGVAFLPSPPLLFDPEGEDEEEEDVVDYLLTDGRVLFTDNQVRFHQIAAETALITCANRFQSYGDVAVLDNQFCVTFEGTGTMSNDTTVTAWSTRTANNRWEDPAATDPIPTTASATTIARMNITALNQATRCIIATASTSTPVVAAINYNQVLTDCSPAEEEEELMLLLSPPEGE